MLKYVKWMQENAREVKYGGGKCAISYILESEKTWMRSCFLFTVGGVRHSRVLHALSVGV